jgi:hypothetical protein
VALQVDAHADLFRRLAPGERAATLRDVLLLEAAQTVLVHAEGDAAQAAQALARQLVAGADQPVAAEGWDRSRPALLVGVGSPQAVAAALGLAAPALPDGAPASAVAWAAAGAAAPTLVLAAADAAALQAAAPRLRHYGAQSWVRFDGARLRDQGRWAAAADNALAARR